jgi:hypothetical protein
MLYILKREYTVNAIQFKRDCFEEIREFTNGRAIEFRTERCINGKSYCEVSTNLGLVTATEGDYIVKNNKGSLRVVDAKTFEDNYKPSQNSHTV